MVQRCKHATLDDVESIFNKLDVSQQDFGEISEIRNNTRSLIAKNDVFIDSLNDIISLKDLCNRRKYREILERRNNYLQKHQVMDASDFAQLFGNEDLKNRSINNNGLVSGKYNKSDINQGKLGICIFDTFLRQIKETPFFETLIRCSLQRNEENNGWKCLIPFCNNEGHYEEISDEDIDYLKNSKIGSKQLISNSSLGFNILETLLVKMVGNKEKYPGLGRGWGKYRDGSGHYDDLKTVPINDLNDIMYGIDAKIMRDTFLGNDVIKNILITEFSDEEVEWLINLIQTGIIKFNTGTIHEKINSYIKKNIPDFGNSPKTNDSIEEDSNESTLKERGYPLKILYQAGPDEDVSIGKANGLGLTFKIKGTKEWFVQGHHYSIESIHKRNGETFVTIINPRYTGNKINIPIKYLKDFFYIGVSGFDIDKMFLESDENEEIK